RTPEQQQRVRSRSRPSAKRLPLQRPVPGTGKGAPAKPGRSPSAESTPGRLRAMQQRLLRGEVGADPVVVRKRGRPQPHHDERTGLFRYRNGGTRGWRPTIRLDQRVPRWAREEAQMPIASAVAGRHVALDPLAPGMVLLGRLGSRDWLFVE